MEITEFKKVGKKSLYKLFVDGEFYAIITDETIVLNNLKTNTYYSQQYLSEIVTEGQKKVAFENALDIISKFSKTEKELRRYLKEKGYLQTSIDYAITKLKEYNYLNDENYAQYYISMKSSQKGKKAIAFELKQKGIAEDIINAELEKIENQTDIIYSLAKKFAKNKLADEKFKEKIFRHLASKGFDFEDINATIRKGEENDWN